MNIASTSSAVPAAHSEVVTRDESPPPLKRLRLVGSGSTHLSAASDASHVAADPVLTELFGTLKISHNSAHGHLRSLNAENLVKHLRSTISQLQPDKPLETRLAASNYLLNVAASVKIPNKLLFSLFELVQKPNTPVSVLNILLKTVWVVSKDSNLVRSRLVKICSQLLSSNFHRTAQSCCLEILGDVADVISDSELLLKAFEELSRNHDSRVRRAVVEMIGHYDCRGGKISLSVYHRCLELLQDENENVRIEAIKIICSYAKRCPNVKVPIGDKGDDGMRLEEHAFSKICELVNDIQVSVRVTSVTILRQFVNVDQSFLQQTLDKQLMSQLRTKRSLHQRNSDLVRSGAYSSGRKWGDDAPLDGVDENSLSLISSGACGALVHGLEDEFKEVRIATVETLSHLSCNRAVFAKDALDFFIDMLNDEIELVRVKALESLATISHHVVLRKDQVVDTLSCLDDYSDVVREKVHALMKKIQFEEMACLKLTLQRLMRNLKKYPSDKTSIFAALKHLGLKHSQFVMPYMKELLCAHPYLDTTEPNVSDPFYMAIMVLVLNAASSSSHITGLFPPFISRHHQFLRELHPQFIPELDLNKNQLRFCYKRPESAIVHTDVSTLALNQYHGIVGKLTSTHRLSLDLLQNLTRDLHLLKNCSHISGPANFLSASLKIQSSMLKVFEKLKRQTPTSQLSLADESVFAELKKCISLNFYLETVFNGCSAETSSRILENRCLLATLLVFFSLLNESKTSDVSFKIELCRNFVRNVQVYQARIVSSDLSPSPFCNESLAPLLAIDPSKLTLISKFLHPLLINFMAPSNQAMSSIILNQSEMSAGVTMSAAVINFPQNSDRVESFMAGLLLALRLDVTLKNVTDINRVRVVLTYPGGTDQVVSPSADKFREVSAEEKTSKEADYRVHKLNTTCFISHSSWTEPADLRIGVFLAVQNLFDPSLSLDCADKLVSISETVNIVIHPKPTAI